MEKDFDIDINEISDENLHQVIISGELTIDNTPKIKNFLLNKVFHLESVLISITKCTNIDLSVVQLIVGFLQSRYNSKNYTITDFNLDDIQTDLLASTGVSKLISELQKKNQNE